MQLFTHWVISRSYNSCLWSANSLPISCSWITSCFILINWGVLQMISIYFHFCFVVFDFMPIYLLRLIKVFILGQLASTIIHRQFNCLLWSWTLSDVHRWSNLFPSSNFFLDVFYLLILILTFLIRNEVILIPNIKSLHIVSCLLLTGLRDKICSAL